MYVQDLKTLFERAMLDLQGDHRQQHLTAKFVAVLAESGDV